MKNNITTNVMIVSVLTALASVASGQAVNAAGAARAVVPPPAPVFRPMMNVSAAAARTPVLPPVAAAAQSHGQAGIGAPASPGLNPNATAHASVEGQANGLAVAAVASDRTGTTLRMDDTVKAIHEATFATRDGVTADVQARLDASAKLVAELRLRAEAAGDKSRAAFAKALVEVRKQEKELRASLRAATKAEGESTWGEVQSELAKSYGAYAEAVAHAEVAAQTPAEPAETPKS